MPESLLQSLSLLTQRLGRPVSEVSLRASIPVDQEGVTPEQAIQALERAGFSAKLEKRALKKIPDFLFPVLLLLEDQQSCLLAALGDQEAQVVYPGQGEIAQPMSRRQLESQYAGAFIQVTPAAESPAAVDNTEERTRFWFWGTIAKSWGLYGEVVAASLMINLFTLAIPLFVMNVYDRVIPNSASETLWVLAIGVALVLGFDFLLRMLRGWFLDRAGKRSDLLISQMIMDHLLGMRMEAQPRSAGAVSSHLREFENLREFFTSSTLIPLIDLPFLILFLGIIQLLAGEIMWIPLLGVIIVLLVSFLLQFPVHRHVKAGFEQSANKQGVLVEALTGMEAIKSQGAERVFLGRWKGAVTQLASSAQRGRFWGILAANLSTLVHQLTLVAVVVVGASIVTVGEMTIGALVAVTILTGRVMAPLGNMVALLGRYRQSRVALKALDQMMQLPLERPHGERFMQRPAWQGGVEFDRVTFSYPDQPTPVLGEFSLKVDPGERVGVIGKVGSGKSTILRLMLGLYQPQSGVVRVDGTDLMQLDPVEIRHRAGMVPQEVTLFSGTLRDNLTLGLPGVDDAVLLRAAQIAGVDAFAQHHPAGYSMQIGEHGRGLSGGQQQAVALARALILDPSILLLDEPTSAMDNRAEQEIRQRLLEVLPGKTLVLVTHRTSLLSLVDRLVVVDQGRVVMDGERDAVLKRLSGLGDEGVESGK